MCVRACMWWEGGWGWGGEMTVSSGQLIADLCRREHWRDCAQMCGRQTETNTINLLDFQPLGIVARSQILTCTNNAFSWLWKFCCAYTGAQKYCRVKRGVTEGSIKMFSCQTDSDTRRQQHMSMGPTVSGPYHNQPSLQQMCSQCGGSVFWEPFLSFHLTLCQYSYFCETEHSERDSSETGSTFTDKLWTLTTRTFRLFHLGMSMHRVAMGPPPLHHTLVILPSIG